MKLDDDVCWGAIAARDRRFDGLFYVGVSTTGVYCRPVCTARTPGRDRCSYYVRAAEAERAGFRACFRCRPELAPGNATIDAVPRLVAAAVSLVDEGYLNEHGVADLARTLGVGARHLRRAMEEQIGVSPVELAQSRRLALAKRLLQDSSLGLADVAFASGFKSVRRFNGLFRARFGRAPSTLRREHSEPDATSALTLRLDFRPPLDWPALLGFLRARAIPGVEHVGANEYARVVKLGDVVGTIRVRPDARRAALRADVSIGLETVLMKLVARLRAVFDLDARPDVIGACLGGDSLLAPVVHRHPGLRLPGSLDPFETTVRAVLGQQVSVAAATTLAGRLVARFGRPLGRDARDVDRALTHAFPSAAELARARVDHIAAIGLPGKRAETLRLVARTFASGASAGAPRDAIVSQLASLPGIGPWTAQYVAMRALGDPDAFPASDLGVRKALGGASLARTNELADRWRPWRAYAVMYLWTSLAEGAQP